MKIVVLLVFLGELSLWLVIGEIDQLGARKDTCDCVVIFDRDGIKLVVVASSTGHSQTLKGAHHRIDLIGPLLPP